MATVGENPWNDITYGNGKYVAVGYIPITENNIVTRYGQIAYSSDGVSWTTKRIDAKELEGVCYGGGKFVAAEDNSSKSSVAYSSDGINWETNEVLEEDEECGGICYGDGKFVAVRSNGIRYSTDLQKWTDVSVKVLSFRASLWTDIAYKDGVGFVMVSRDSDIAISSDGINWSFVDSGASEDFNCVCIMQ